jgi:UDPglucose 6-dehydrogenase
MSEHIDGCVRPGSSGSDEDPVGRINIETKSFPAGRISNRKPKIGVIGLGSVGGALKAVMSNFFEVIGYDVIGHYDWGPVLDCDAVFVCVQTPQGPDGRLDCSHVKDVLIRLSKDRYPGIVVIKSTLRVGFMDYAVRSFPTLKFVYSPEFMSERYAFLWTANPDRIVLSGKEEYTDFVEGLYHWTDGTKIIRTDFRSAEIGKLAHNAYIALKVTFTNTMEKISESADANADDVMRIVYTDRRVNNSAHLEPHKGPYGGKCVPKDTAELINAFGDLSTLLKVADEINTSIERQREEKVACTNPDHFDL